MSNQEEIPKCPICIDDVVHEDAEILSCNHIMHQVCYAQLIEKSNHCPVCRATIRNVDTVIDERLQRINANLETLMACLSNLSEFNVGSTIRRSPDDALWIPQLRQSRELLNKILSLCLQNGILVRASESNQPQSQPSRMTTIPDPMLVSGLNLEGFPENLSNLMLNHLTSSFGIPLEINVRTRMTSTNYDTGARQEWNNGASTNIQQNSGENQQAPFLYQLMNLAQNYLGPQRM